MFFCELVLWRRMGMSITILMNFMTTILTYDTYVDVYTFYDYDSGYLNERNEIWIIWCPPMTGMFTIKPEGCIFFERKMLKPKGLYWQGDWEDIRLMSSTWWHLSRNDTCRYRDMAMIKFIHLEYQWCMRVSGSCYQTLAYSYGLWVGVVLADRMTDRTSWYTCGKCQCLVGTFPKMRKKYLYGLQTAMDFKKSLLNDLPGVYCFEILLMEMRNVTSILKSMFS